MQKEYLFLLPLALAVGCSSGGIGNKESAQEAVDALQAVDSAISVGTNMVDYRQALVPARTEVDQYLAKDSDSEFAQSLSRAMDGHQTANDWWQCKVAQPENSLETRWDAQYRCQDSVFPALFALYPEIEEKVDAVVAGLQSPPKYKSGSLDSDAILQYIWQQTSADTAKAIEAL